ncbi:MAG: aspartate--tRNA ligase [Syntrophales bacterium]|nr:aspartate--tRNA ligase [Syntrophales bacterium]
MTEKKRTHYCGDLKASHVGETVTLMGWTHRRRDHGGVIFVDLRDRDGITQIVFNPEIAPKAHEEAHKIRSEYVLAVRGKVRNRLEGMENPQLKTGAIEVMVEELEILNESRTPPFVLDADSEISEAIRLKYRYLDLRRQSIQKNLILRNTVASAARAYLQDHGFIDVETPFLTKSTPEGARDYLVPSRISPGMFYALPQSPQLFKQLLMISGFDRYYQIVKCFRDEDLRADRQPEFTQIDMELSFMSEEDIMDIMEGLMAHIFKAGIGAELERPFQRLKWAESIERYGRDNPDTRFGLELRDVTDLVKSCGFKVFAEAASRGGIVKALRLEDGKRLSRKDLDELPNYVSDFGAKGLAWARVNENDWTSPIFKFLTPAEVNAINERMEAAPGDLIFFVADVPGVVNDALGSLRIRLARKLGLIRAGDLSFTWVTGFPMFEYSDTEKRFIATHHPFTAPVEDDIPLLLTDPGRVRARAYDLVLNGSEIGGGSIRIHRSDVQSTVFKALELGEDEVRSKFGFLIDALEYGTPPHGGIAFGLDRIIMLMAGAESIRDVIAFPKTQKATCLLTDAPSPATMEQLMELSLKVIKE